MVRDEAVHRVRSTGTAASSPDSSAPTLDGPFVRAIERWEALPHNLDGSDKTWVERLLDSSRCHYHQARQSRG